jgi:hypothetical protein
VKVMIIAVLALICTAARCGPSTSLTGPSAGVPNFEGVWSGTYQVEDCQRTVGAGSSYCRFVVGGSLFIRVELQQQGQQLSGEVSFGNNLGTVITRRGSLSGQVDPSGHAALSGTTTFVTPEQPGKTELTDWTSELTPDGRLSGRFTENLQFTNAFGPQTSREQGRLDNLTKQ